MTLHKQATKKPNLIMLLDDFETSLQPRALHRLEDSSQPYTEEKKGPNIFEYQKHCQARRA